MLVPDHVLQQTVQSIHRRIDVVFMIAGDIDQHVDRVVHFAARTATAGLNGKQQGRGGLSRYCIGTVHFHDTVCNAGWIDIGFGHLDKR